MSWWKISQVAHFLQITVNMVTTTSALLMMMMMMIKSGKKAPKPAPSPHTSSSAVKKSKRFLSLGNSPFTTDFLKCCLFWRIALSEIRHISSFASGFSFVLHISKQIMRKMPKPVDRSVWGSKHGYSSSVFDSLATVRLHRVSAKITKINLTRSRRPRNR